jgi:hypothetical protein
MPFSLEWLNCIRMQQTCKGLPYLKFDFLSSKLYSFYFEINSWRKKFKHTYKYYNVTRINLAIWYQKTNSIFTTNTIELKLEVTSQTGMCIINFAMLPIIRLKFNPTLRTQCLQIGAFMSIEIALPHPCTSYVLSPGHQIQIYMAGKPQLY